VVFCGVTLTRRMEDLHLANPMCKFL
jgi:hypothetical protein